MVSKPCWARRLAGRQRRGTMACPGSPLSHQGGRLAKEHHLLFGLLLAAGLLADLAWPCPAPCQCFGSTTVFCTEELLAEVPEGIPPNATQLLFVTTSLESVPSRALAHCSALASLAFLDNPLRSLAEAAFAGLPRLEELEISGASGLTALPGGALLGLANLSRLSVKFSPIDTLEAGLFNHTPRLEALHLLGNRISCLPPDLFRPLKQLQTLDVSQNRLASLPGQLFGPLSRLQVLKLSDNSLSSLPPALFSPLASLQELFLDGNALTELPPGTFAGLAHLRLLHLQHNTFRGLQPSTFPPSLPSLAVLNLDSNQLTELPESLLEGTLQLRALSLAYNQLQRIPERLFSQLAQLSTLVLSHNCLSSLPPTVFHSLPALARLDLAHNNLTTLPRDAFANLTSLEVLDIAHNRLAALPEGLFATNDLLYHVALKGNPWACDCQLAYLAEWLQQGTEVLLNSQAFCRSPAHLKGRDLPTLRKEQLLCLRNNPGAVGCRAETPPDPSVEADDALPGCTYQDATGAVQLVCEAGSCHQLSLRLPPGESLNRSGQALSRAWSLDASCGTMRRLRLRVSIEEEEEEEEKPLQG